MRPQIRSRVPLREQLARANRLLYEPFVTFPLETDVDKALEIVSLSEFNLPAVDCTYF